MGTTSVLNQRRPKRRTIRQSEETVKRWTLMLTATVLLVGAGCGKKKDNNGPGDNPIDQYMEPLFEAQGLEMVEATNTEVCRRLYADLLGRFPSADDVAKDCAGKRVDQIVRNFQSNEDYIWTSMEHWRDTLDTNDVGEVGIDWRYLKTLYADVAELHRGNLAYDEFAIRTLQNPGYLLQVLSPTERTARVFETFMGRPATDAEMNDLSALFRPWLPVGDPDPDFSYVTRTAGGIAPVLCQPLSSCEAHLLGGAVLDFGVSQQFEVIAYEDLTAEQLEVLRVPGELFSSQPMFYEAAADEILNRLLGWDDGGRFPTSPGVILPEVRQIVADVLRDTGSYPEAEAVVLTSILYRGASEIEPDGFGDDPDAPQPPHWAHGPVKYTRSETWLDSALSLLEGTIDIPRCDPRYTDLFAGYFQIQQAYEGGQITATQAGDDIAKLAGLQEIRMPLTDYDGQIIYPVPDTQFIGLARLIGGCPGFQSNRFDGRAGLSYSFSQESLAEAVCAYPTNLMQNDTSAAGILTEATRLFLGRDPAAEEIADIEAAYATCDPGSEDCSVNGLANSVCVAVLGSNESILY